MICARSHTCTRLRTPVRLALAGLLFLLAGANCLLTQQFGLTPPDGTEGRVVRSMITDHVWIGYYWGVLGNCEQAPDTNGCMIEGNNDLVRSIALIAVVTPDMISLNDDGYYTNESVRTCVQTVREQATLFTFNALDGTLECVTKPTDGREACFPRESKLLETAFTVPALSVPFCELRDTGIFVSAGFLNI